MRRIWLLSALILAATRASSPAVARAERGLWRGLAEARFTDTREGGQAPQNTPQPPTFRGGTNLVQVDAIVADPDGAPIVNLTAADFDLLDDGKPVTIDRVRFLGSAEYSGDPTLAPIRSHDDEEREASRDDVRVYAIVLDDYHVPRMAELRVIEPLLAFVRQLPPTDLVAVYYPLDSVTDVAFSRDREPVLKAIRAFYGRLGDDTPKHPVEEEHLRHPLEIPRIRRQIVMSSLEGLAIHLGGIKQGRKTIVWVTEAFSQPLADVRELYEAANRANVAIYPLDPRGLTTDASVDRPLTRGQALEMMLPAREFMRTLAFETGGRTIFTNDVSRALGQVIRDSRAYYLIAYESPHPDDGKFHRVSVKVKRARATVFARTGYWSFKRGENGTSPASAAPVVPIAVQTAFDRLADSLRPNADEPTESPRHILPPPPAPTAPPPLLAPPTVLLARGRTVSDPVSRREFHRVDLLVLRAGVRSSGASAGQTAAEPVAVSGRLLDRFGQPLTDLPVTSGPETCELRLPLGTLGPGDYVVELIAHAGDEAAQQYVAFRVLR